MTTVSIVVTTSVVKKSSLFHQLEICPFDNIQITYVEGSMYRVVTSTRVVMIYTVVCVDSGVDIGTHRVLFHMDITYTLMPVIDTGY